LKKTHYSKTNAGLLPTHSPPSRRPCPALTRPCSTTGPRSPLVQCLSPSVGGLSCPRGSIAFSPQGPLLCSTRQTRPSPRFRPPSTSNGLLTPPFSRRNPPAFFPGQQSHTWTIYGPVSPSAPHIGHFLSKVQFSIIVFRVNLHGHTG